MCATLCHRNLGGDKLSSESLFALWQARLSERKSSGLSIKSWCAAHEIPEHRYYSWQRKLSPSVQPSKSSEVDWLSLLELNMDKTRLIKFGPTELKNRELSGSHGPDTFDFLGFTHYCSRTRKGRFVVKRQTAKKKMQAKLAEIRKELRKRLSDPIKDVGIWLGKLLQRHYAYYGVPFNAQKLAAFRYHVACRWKQSLSRRSHKGRACNNWNRMKYLTKRYLPPSRICHPYPNERRAVTI